MKKIMFVCLGNICRSPMAEFIFANEVSRRGLEEKYEAYSAATSSEAQGSDMYFAAKAQLKMMGVPFERRRARKLKAREYDDYDLFIAMDRSNYHYLCRLFSGDPNGKVRMMLSERDVDDPWYTGNFQKAYDDICLGTERLIEELEYDQL